LVVDSGRLPQQDPIAYDMITHPKKLDALYNEKLPHSANYQIARRDGKALSR